MGRSSSEHRAQSQGPRVIGAPSLLGIRKQVARLVAKIFGSFFYTALLLSTFYTTSFAQDACIDGIAAGLYPCKNIDLLSVLDRSEIATLVGDREAVRLNDVWGWTEDVSKREFVLAGRNNGVSFIEITDPVNPVYLGDLPFHAGANISTWRDIKTYQNFAYIVSDGSGNHGVQIFDLNGLLGVQNPPVLFQESGHYDGVASVHNIVINEARGFAYAVGSNRGGTTCGGGLHVMLLNNPLSPAFGGCVQILGTGRLGTGYTHDAQCVVYRGPDAEFQGKDICVLFSENAISIVDVSNPLRATAISIIEYPLTEYSHQGWLSPDQKTLYADDELDELRLGLEKTRTLVFDVSDLAAPRFLTEIEGRTGSIDHNQYTRGGFLYQSNYTSGLTIWDVSDPSNPAMEGFFDTFAPDDEVNFNGSWSNFPFFSSGTAVVSDRDAGLFLLSTPSIKHDQFEGGILLREVFPNPARDWIKFRMVADATGPATARLIDIMGRTVLEKDLDLLDNDLYTYRFSTSNIAAGAYFLSIESAIGNVLRPVLIH